MQKYARSIFECLYRLHIVSKIANSKKQPDPVTSRSPEGLKLIVFTHPFGCISI
jgi:hypothetical protein